MNFFMKTDRKIRAFIILLLLVLSMISVFSFELVPSYRDYLVEKIYRYSSGRFNHKTDPFFQKINTTNVNGSIYVVYSDEKIWTSVLKYNNQYYVCYPLFITQAILPLVINNQVHYALCENGLIRTTYFQNYSEGIYSTKVNYGAQTIIDELGRLPPGTWIDEKFLVINLTQRKDINSLMPRSNEQFNYSLANDLDDDFSGIACFLHGQFLTNKAPQFGSYVFLGKNEMANSGCCGDDYLQDTFIYSSGNFIAGCFKGYAFLPGYNYNYLKFNVTLLNFSYSKNRKFTIDNRKYIYNAGFFNGTHIQYAEFITPNSLKNFTDWYPLNLLFVFVLEDSNYQTGKFVYCGSKGDSFTLILSNHSYIVVIPPSQEVFLLKEWEEVANDPETEYSGYFVCDGQQFRFFRNKEEFENYRKGMVQQKEFASVSSYIRQNLGALWDNYNFFDYEFTQPQDQYGEVNNYYERVSIAGDTQKRITFNIDMNKEVLFELPHLNRIGFSIFSFNLKVLDK
ncbi:MAG: hypothetical protein QXD62_03230 [Candidatus Woesearchaeota archaeon]